MLAANEWGRLVEYETIGGASVLTLPFILDTEGGLDRSDFSLIGERHGGRLNVSEDIESVMVAALSGMLMGALALVEGLLTALSLAPNPSPPHSPHL